MSSICQSEVIVFGTKHSHYLHRKVVQLQFSIACDIRYWSVRLPMIHVLLEPLSRAQACARNRRLSSAIGRLVLGIPVIQPVSYRQF